MPTTDQSHLRKYLATLGVAVVAGVISVSGLTMRLQDDLLVKQSDLAQLTPLARETLERRQHFAEVATTVLPWFFGIGVVGGLILAGFGILGWAKRQRVLDDIEDTTRDRARLELRTLTQPEREQRLTEEVSAAVEGMPAVATHPEPPLDQVRQRIVFLEAVLADKLLEITEHVETQVRLPGAPAVIADVVAYDSRGWPYVFELKYASSAGNVTRRLHHGAAQVERFVRATNDPRARGFVVVLAPDAEIRPHHEETAADISAGEVHVLVLGERAFGEMTSAEFAKRLGLF